MSFVHGRQCQILVDNADISAFFRGTELSADVDTADTTTYRGDGWHTHIAGLAAATVEFDGLYDPTFQADAHSLIQTSPGDILTYAPAGLDVVGDQARLVLVQAANLTETATPSDAVLATLSVQATGRVGFGVVLHPLGEKTVDANGTAVDHGAATTGGWIAHLHVSAVGGTGDTLDVTIEDSANGTDWALLTSGTFDTVTATGAQRLLFEPATVRQHIRAVWDITANGGTNQFTFAVAFARIT